MSKTMVHHLGIRFPARQLCVEHDEPDRPVRHARQDDKEEDTHDKACAGNGIGQTNNSSTEDRVGHL